jgi:hypothetical protein
LRPLILVCALASVAAGDPLVHRVSLAGGGDVWLRPEFGGHGFGILQYELSGLPEGGRFVLTFNSDTLRIAVEHLQLSPTVEAGADVKGEALIAGVLTDYYRDGRRDAGRGFYASYGSASAWLKRSSAPHYVELAVTARRWIFTRTSDTSPSLVLPPDAWVGELRGRYTFWSMRSDPSLYEAQRLYPRARGIAFGVEAGLDARSEVRPWGELTVAPVDARNDPGRTIVSLRAWLLTGAQVHDRVRLQLYALASWMWGEDDLVRLRVGGLNPYVVPIAGAPWAALLSGRLAAAHATLHVRLWRELEAGVMIDGVVVDDVHRTAPARAGGEVGLGAFADLRLGAWQIDVRAGWSPTITPDDLAGGVSVWASLGWAWQR